MRWWRFDTIDTAEVDADISLDFTITPLAEYCIGKKTANPILFFPRTLPNMFSDTFQYVPFRMLYQHILLTYPSHFLRIFFS